jgi:catechol 2,3-dioxygenase-like lactoylglutathione lyase family enzyme
VTAARMQISATVLGAPEPQRLAEFYARLLGWQVVESDPTWARVKPPSGQTGLSFQLEEDYRPPSWPDAAAGQQRMEMHLDIAVDDLEAAVARAIEAGARLADYQPQEHVRVMVDPAGHIFDLFEFGT